MCAYTRSTHKVNKAKLDISVYKLVLKLHKRAKMYISDTAMIRIKI